MMRAKITGVGIHLPERRLTNADLEKLVDTNDEWIVTRTGIRERRILGEGRGTSHMAIRAARMILENNNLSPDEIDLIIVATSTPDMLVPATAAFVQKEIGARNSWGFDVNGGCAGFLCALATGSQFIETGRHDKVLVIGADKMSAIIDYQDRNTCVIFGDGAGAILIEPTDEKNIGIRDFEMHVDGTGTQYLYVEGGGSLHPASEETVQKRMHYVFQDGKSVFKRAIAGMSDVSQQLLEKNHLQGDDIRLLIPHQANVRIIDAVSKKLGLKDNQVVINIDKYGNTTSATIPIAMFEACSEKRMKKGDWIVLSAFGAGFTWGSILMTWALD